MSVEVQSQIEPQFQAQCDAVYAQWESGNLELREAIRKIEEFKVQAHQAKHDCNEGYAENMLGIMRSMSGNFNKGIRHFELAQKCFRDGNFPLRVAGTIMNIGESYRRRGDTQRALGYFNEAFEASKNVTDIRFRMLIRMNQGRAAMALNRLDEAKNYFLETLKKSDELLAKENFEAKLIDDRCENYTSLVEVCLKRDEIDEAWEYAQLALNAAHDLNKDLHLGLAYRALAATISHLPQTPEGFSQDVDKYFDQSMRYFKNIDAEAEVAETLYIQGVSYYKRMDKRAIICFQQALNTFNRLGMRGEAKRATKALTGQF